MSLPAFTYPADDEPLLSWCRRHGFEAVFVVLHPFFRVPGLHPSGVQHGTTVFDVGEISDNAFRRLVVDQILRGAQARDQEPGPHLDCDTIKRHATPSTWSELRRATRIEDDAAVSRALLTSIGALNRAHAEPALAEMVAKWCENAGVFYPSEGDLQPLLERPFGAALRRAGYVTATIADEFGASPAVSIGVDQLMFGDSVANSADFVITQVYSTDRAILLLVHWDSFFSLVCGPREVIDDLVDDPLLEGFAASPDTTHRWWARPGGL